MNFSKKLFLLSCLLVVSVATAKKSKKLQLLVVPTDPSYFFVLNTGAGIVNNPGAIRPQGSYYLTTALIFPGDTVDKDATNYSFDKNGNPINFNNNIGMAYFEEFMLQQVDFANPPALNSRIELSRIDLIFKNHCGSPINSLYGLGEARIGTFPVQPGVAIVNFEGGLSAGAGCNTKLADKNNYKAQVYLPQTGSVVSLIEIEFADDINYKKN